MRALVACDGSPDCLEAIRAAGQLLAPAEAIVLHVRTPPPADEETLAEVRRGRSLAEVTAEQAAREEAASQALADEGAHLAQAVGWQATGRTALTYGGVWDEILRCANEANADVIVLGARGVTGTRAALGSVSDAVVHEARQPVLVVPQRDGTSVQVSEPAPALIAYDGSAGAAAALDAAIGLLSPRELLICHVEGDRAQDDMSHAMLDEALNRALAAGRDARVVPAPGAGITPGLTGRAWHAIVAAADEQHAHVIVVGSRRRSAARELLLGSVAMGLLHHARQPVMVAPPAQDQPA